MITGMRSGTLPAKLRIAKRGRRLDREREIGQPKIHGAEVALIDCD
jgi:hypothetical protein